MIVTPCFRLDPDIHQALNTVRESLERDGDEPEGSDHARIRVLVVDQITLLFKDHITNTNSGGEPSHSPPPVVQLLTECKVKRRC